MSRSVNKVIIIGNLTRDPDMRFLPNGNPVCSISLATDEGYKDKNTGQKVEKTEYHRVEAFGRLAEIIGEYLKKGSKCYVEGKLRTDEYEKDGIKRYSTKIIASEMVMLGGSNAQEGGQPGHGQQKAPQQQAPVQQKQNLGYYFEDGQAMTPEQTKYYTSQKIKPWAKGQKPPVVELQPQAQPNNSFDGFDDDIPF